MKKTIIYLSILAMTFAIGGCSGNEPKNSGEGGSMNPSDQTSNISGASQNTTSSAASLSDEDQQFYSQSTIYVTWLNVWDGSTEAWWTKTSSSGTKVLYPGIDTETASLNWGDSSNRLRQYYMDQVKGAGIDAVVLDLTNGISWGSACSYIAQYCAGNGMKFSAAVHGTSEADFEQKARQIWDRYASGAAAYSGAYLYKDGKPVLVAYVDQNTWDRSINRKLQEYGSKFTVVWSSGENPRADKWGWQNPAGTGPMPSSDSMFVTASINWTAPAWSITGWRKSLAYLDYGFLTARKNSPKYMIVSSFDDMRERHGWMVADTSSSSFNYRILVHNTADKEGTPGLQMRNVLGRISTDAYYNRVKEWITEGEASAFYPGGILPDGAYQMENVYSGKGLTSENPSAYNPEDGAKPIDFTNDKAGVPMTQQARPGYQQYMFFYHLGSNEYRIIRLCVGFSLEDRNGSVVVDWDSESDGQRWIVEKTGDCFVFINKSSGKALCVSSKTSPAMTAAKDAGDEKQQWKLTEIAVFK
ncbi:MAG: RICIN domain-containing protein [Saccharofermentanales bacterium]